MDHTEENRGLPTKTANNRHKLQMTVVEQLEHGRLVSNLAYLVGKELDLDEEQLRTLIIAGYLHDIGKAEIEVVTTSSGEEALLVEEINTVRQHPKKGYEILKRHGYDDAVCEAVLHHHENYDGTGYPDNLEGWNISIDACILRVCDVFCALVTDRAYRSALQPEAALAMMIEDIRKYDVKVFLAFQRVLHDEDGKIVLPEVQDEVRGVWKTIWN